MLRRIGCLTVLLCCSTFLSAQEMPKPSPEHAVLKKYVGNWDVTMNFMGTSAKCVQTSKMVGDFWNHCVFEGELMGMKFTGHSMTGFDPSKKKYVSTWVDTMSPHPMAMEGTFDEKAKTMTQTGAGVGMDGKPTKNKTVDTWSSDDSYKMQMFEEKDGKWVEAFSCEYKRKK